jgi:5-methylcytosine-specific restriction endonuclease McrA
MSKPERIRASQILELVERQGYRCALTGRNLTPETASIDHRIPLGAGGRHEIGNLWIVEYVVNLAKGTMSVEEFVAMCRDVVRKYGLEGPV